MNTLRTVLALSAVLGTTALAGCQTTEEDDYWVSDTRVYRPGYVAPYRGPRTVIVEDDPVIYPAPLHMDRPYRRDPPPRFDRPPPRVDRPAPPPRTEPRPPSPPPAVSPPRSGGGANSGLGPVGRQPSGGHRGPNGEWLPN